MVSAEFCGCLKSFSVAFLPLPSVCFYLWLSSSLKEVTLAGSSLKNFQVDPCDYFVEAGFEWESLLVRSFGKIIRATGMLLELCASVVRALFKAMSELRC